MPTKAKNKMKCSRCKANLSTCDAPAEATGLFVGKRWSEYAQRVIPVKAWLCDMHADECESGRFVKNNNDPKKKE
jgi:hypothetical protein